MRQLTLAVGLASLMVLVVFAATVWLFDGKPFEPPVAQYQTRASVHRDAIEQLLDAESEAAKIIAASLPATPAVSATPAVPAVPAVPALPHP